MFRGKFSSAALWADSHRPRGSPECRGAACAQVSAAAAMTVGWPPMEAELGSEAAGSPEPGRLPGP